MTTDSNLDFECWDNGLANIRALSEAADDWLADNVDPDGLAYYERFDSPYRTVTGEPRLMLDIAEAMIADGLTCRNSELVSAA